MKKLLLILIAFFVFSGMALAAVNLNTATKEELDSVKGIGPVKAAAIIEYRKKNGSFKTVDDLKNVKGFGDKSVANMRSELTVVGATSVKEEKKDSKADGKAVKEESKRDMKADKADEKVSKEDKKAAKKKAKEDKKAAKEKAKEDKKETDKK